MNLSQLLEIISGCKLVRESEFTNLGLVSYNTLNLLVFIENEKYLSALEANNYVTAVITTEVLAERIPAQMGILIADNPRKVFYSLHNHLATNTDFYWRDFDTIIEAGAKVHPKSFIAEKNVHIGENTVIEPGVAVMERTIIGNNSIIRAGSVIGSPGFEFSRVPEGILSIEHAGGVKIGNDVEIQANCCVNCSVFGGFTTIGNETKLGNLVYIDHNSKIGNRCLIAASAMIAGSVTIGDDVWIGPGACVSSEVTIQKGASITIGAVVTRNVNEHQRVSGNFAIDHDKFIAFLKTIR